MVEIFIICCLLGIAPALLWAFPATRRMTGSWITALKTAPVGCLVMFLLPILLLEGCRALNRIAHVWNAEIDYKVGIILLAFLFGIAPGVLVIRELSRFTWRTYHAIGKRSWLPHHILACVYALVSAVLILLVIYAYYDS